MTSRFASRLSLFLISGFALLTAGIATLPAHASSHAGKAHAGKHSAGKTSATPRAALPYASVKALQTRIEGMKEAAEKKKLDDEAAGTDFLDSVLYFSRQRAYPNDSIDFSAYARGVAQREKMAPAYIGPKQSLAQTFVPSNTWQFVGPTDLGVPYNAYYGKGPLSGRVNDLAYDPATPKTYYLVAAGGGVWKTTDGGSTWSPLSNTWKYQQASCIALDPTNHNTLYVGTGDIAYATYPSGVEKSTDGGNTWTDLGVSTFGLNGINALIVDPETPSIITAASGNVYFGNVYRSTDSGSTWTQAFPTTGIWSDIKYGAKNPNGIRHYYTTSNYTINGNNYDEELWRSDDRGATWSQVTIPATGVDYTEGLVVAPSATAPDTVYLESGNDMILWKSTDAGATWTDITSGLNAAEPGLPGDSTYNWSQGYYDIALTTFAGPGGADTVYDSLIDLARSTDSGSTFTSLGGPTYNQSGGSVLHNDQHAVAINPSNSNDVLVGCDGGVYHYVFPSGTSAPTITSLNQNLGITQFYKADYHPTNPNIIVAGAQDNAGPYCSGTLSMWGNIAGGDGGGCAINQSNPSDQYATSQDLGVYHTTDGWNTEEYISPSVPTGENAPFVGVLTLDPTHPNLLYTGTQYLFQYNSTTGNWTYDLGGTALSHTTTGYLQAIAVAPTNGSVIYTGSVDGDVWVSTTQGTSWTQIDGVGTSSTSPLPGRAITSISVNPSNANDVLVGLSGTGGGHLYHCANTTLGASSVWTNLSGSGTSALPDVPLNAVTRDPDSPTSTYYVATDIGVFATTNSGSAWTNATLPLGLPNVQVDDLKAVPGTHYLNAATYGRGIWRISLTASHSAPTITGFSPTSGPVGTTVVITGTNFTGATVVGFMNEHATSFTVNGAGTQITTTVPSGAVTGPVAVATPGGTAHSSASFTVTTTSGPPTITGFSPTSGPVGTTVVITGTNFTGATVVGFMNEHATSFTVNSPTQITTSVPSGAVTGPVAVATPAGTAHSSASFTVTTTSGPPTITGFSPTSGSVGTSVTITGTNFTGATVVGFQNAHATSFTVVSSTTITTSVPSGAVTGPVAVATPSGTAHSSASFTVTTSSVPTITGFSPTSGPVGTTVVITGTNFTGATVVGFQGEHATSFTVNSSTQITTTVPSGAVTGPVAVATPAGTAHSSASFTVTAH